MYRRRVIFLLFSICIYCDQSWGSSLQDLQQSIIDKDWNEATRLTFELSKKHLNNKVLLERVLGFYKNIPTKHIILVERKGNSSLNKLVSRAIAGQKYKNFYLSFKFERSKIQSVKLKGSTVADIPLNKLNDEGKFQNYVSNALSFKHHTQVYTLEVQFSNNDINKYQWLMTAPKISNFAKEPLSEIKVSPLNRIEAKWTAFKTRFYRNDSKLSLYHQILTSENSQNVVWSKSDENQTLKTQKIRIKSTDLVSRSKNNIYYFKTSFTETLKTDLMDLSLVTRFSKAFELQKN